ncbi:MAG TPA: hypothetical protein EYO34_08000 [Candidatus Marinimicrobia bacterium]|nr:hypothetical protein [Candidatus Neomarinimicrobiota bacterium]
MINHHGNCIFTHLLLQHTGNTNNNHIKLSIPQFCLSRHFIITIDEFNSYFFNSLTYVLTFKIVNDMGY